MDLYLVRHGIPVEMDEWNGADSTRPLAAEGEAQAEGFFRQLRESGELGPVESILTSPLARARRTAEIAGEVLGAPVESVAELASGAAPSLVLAMLARRKALPRHLMLVGHNPDLPMLVGVLAGEPSFSHGLDRCGVVRLEGRLELGAMRVVWRQAPDPL